MVLVLMKCDSNNVCKGYANVGLIQNLEHQVSSIRSIPATYDVSFNLAFLSTI